MPKPALRDARRCTDRQVMHIRLPRFSRIRSSRRCRLRPRHLSGLICAERGGEPAAHTWQARHPPPGATFTAGSLNPSPDPAPPHPSAHSHRAAARGERPRIRIAPRCRSAPSPVSRRLGSAPTRTRMCPGPPSPARHCHDQPGTITAVRARGSPRPWRISSFPFSSRRPSHRLRPGRAISMGGPAGGGRHGDGHSVSPAGG